MTPCACGLAVLALFGFRPLSAQGSSPRSALAAIVHEATAQSEVMSTAHWFSDVYGPRLTGSPLDSMARVWAMKRMREWGLSNVHAEPFVFPWSSWMTERFHMAVRAPVPFAVTGVPAAWSIGTDSLVKSAVVIASIRTPADTVEWRGKLQGKAVLVSPPLEGYMLAPGPSVVLTTSMLDQMVRTGEPWHITHPDLASPINRFRATPEVKGPRLSALEATRFLHRQGASLIMRASERGVGGNVDTGVWWDVSIPQVSVSSDDYSRMYRLVERGTPVEMEFEIRNRSSSAPATPFNVLAELPGTDRRAEVVMLGAHLDSWNVGTGATDNAAGAAVMMEAMRILRATGLPLRRTVRLALWSGEEQGNLGSSAYSKAHLGTMTGPRGARVLVPGPEHSRLSAYFNLDSGTGAIRALDTYGNGAATPVLERWLRELPLDSLGIAHVVSVGGQGSDAAEFTAIGLPAFEFMQDPLTYESVSHHRTADTFDRLVPENLQRNAIIVAAIVYLAANHEALMPRKQ
ncbi:MAG TPA: M20/M25/M40 family metallo-hydrolase [Gemmatimonas sp.]|nr:M20/M25/M40 family metallo-hydrolase [Gemmatimonas sp.]